MTMSRQEQLSNRDLPNGTCCSSDMCQCLMVVLLVSGRVTAVSRCDMRALCSVRGPLSGDTRALGAGARLLSLRMPGQLQPIHFVVEAKARVKELKALATEQAHLQGMIDTDLFGLALLQSEYEDGPFLHCNGTIDCRLDIKNKIA